jgi:hypothetical protein
MRINDYQKNVRFMIDTITYRKLHQRNKEDRFANFHQPKTVLTELEMQKDKPPFDDFYFLLPANILGYNMLEKRWSEFVAKHYLSNETYAL